MTISKISTLVTAPWLRQQILPAAEKLTSHLRLLDTSWVPMPNVDGYNIYKEGHIPTSLHFDLKTVSPSKEGTYAKFSLPEPEEFQDYAKDLGISSHTHVVLYDRMDHKPSFRSWFLFRLFGHDKISVLNGGLQNWMANGFPLTTQELDVEPGDFESRFRRHLLRDFDFMTANIQEKTEQVVDSRGYGSFAGINEDSAGGHIPGSVNIPFNQLFSDDGSFKPEVELKKLFDKANVDLTKPMVATCQTATTACSLAAAAFMLGKKDVPVYNGSFTEWSVRADPNNIAKLKNEE